MGTNEQTGSRPSRAAVVAVAVLATVVLVLVTGRAEVRAGDAAASAAAKPKGKADPRPNIVVVMTDDQNVEQMKALPKTRSLIGGEGTTFSRSYVTTPLCCPARATYLTGQYAHNHKVFTTSAPVGGYSKLKPKDRTLPVWLRRAGYYTAHIGKYLNGYVRKSGVPPGWDNWQGSIDSSTYQMYGYTLNENGTFRTYGEQAVEDPAYYQTDVYSRKAAKVVSARAPKSRPFFLSVATLAPHGERLREAGSVDPRPAPRDAGAYGAEPLPQPPSFNEADVSDKPSGIASKPLLDAGQVSQVTTRYRSELDSLLAVDDLVANLVGALKRTGELGNTVFIFTSDNGYFHGEHRIQQGKVFVYEESSRVPLLIRGPGIPRGRTVGVPVANVDLAPTILDYARGRADRKVDGVSLRRIARDPASGRARGLVIEAWNKDGVLQYKASHSGRYVYVLHGDGEEELYDLERDPFQLRSRHDDPGYAAVKSDMRVLLRRLDGCRNGTCSQGPRITLGLDYERGRLPAAPDGKRRKARACTDSSVRVTLGGKDVSQATLARFFAAGRRAGSDTSPPFTRKLPRKALRADGPTAIKVLAGLRDGLQATVSGRVPRRCP